MGWLAIAAAVFVIFFARASRKNRRVYRPERRPAVRRLRPGIDVPRQWHPVRSSGSGDLWALGAGAALNAERDRRRGISCDSASDAAYSESYASEERDVPTSTDFTGQGGSSGAGGASGEWSNDASASDDSSAYDTSDSGGDSGSDSSGGGGD